MGLELFRIPASGSTPPAGEGVPVGGAAGQILAKNSANDFDTAWVEPTEGTAGEGVPVGGAAGQILAKNSGDDFDTAWVDAPTGTAGEGVPVGGAAGQILAKNSGDDFDTAWVDAPTGNATPDTYSNSEGLTGKVWTDGKPIYRKVVSMGYLPNTATINIAHGITGLSTLVSISGTCTNGNYRFPMPYSWTSANNNIALLADATNVSITTGSDRSTYTGFAILEYTKNA